ncbi:MAG: hypothetical protein ACR2PB_09675 [Desulfocapsaceae bacterium]
MKTKEFRVKDNRLLFKCPYCGKRRNFTILNNRRKTIKCWDCQGMTRCVFNRRPEPREPQSGLLTLKTLEGKEIIVMMRDISSRGVGFEIMKGKDARRIRRGQEISLTCNWSPAMIPKARFRVQNINGFRIGARVKR